jgi:putative transposase
MARGFVYLVAVIDWSRRQVLSWRVSNTLDTRFSVEALEQTVRHEFLEDHSKENVFYTE